jgi:hypothetical protein
LVKPTFRIVSSSGGACALQSAIFDELHQPRAVEGERVFVAERVSLQAFQRLFLVATPLGELPKCFPVPLDEY